MGFIVATYAICAALDEWKTQWVRAGRHEQTSRTGCRSWWWLDTWRAPAAAQPAVPDCRDAWIRRCRGPAQAPPKPRGPRGPPPAARPTLDASRTLWLSTLDGQQRRRCVFDLRNWSGPAESARARDVKREINTPMALSLYRLRNVKGREWQGAGLDVGGTAHAPVQCLLPLFLLNPNFAITLLTAFLVLTKVS